MTPEEVLEHWQKYERLKVGNRYTFSGPGLMEILSIEERGDLLDVRLRDTYSGGTWTSTIAKAGDRRG